MQQLSKGKGHIVHFNPSLSFVERGAANALLYLQNLLVSCILGSSKLLSGKVTAFPLGMSPKNLFHIHHLFCILFTYKHGEGSTSKAEAFKTARYDYLGLSLDDFKEGTIGLF